VAALAVASLTGWGLAALSATLDEQTGWVKGSFALSFLIGPITTYMAVRAMYHARTHAAGWAMAVILLAAAWVGGLQGPLWRALAYLTPACAAALVVGVVMTLTSRRR